MKTWLKKGFHKFVINENGAVSIYAIIMTLLLFVFNAVLIDYIRIMTAERNVDQAAKAAARSTMANFNQKLTSDYGLFGFDGDVGEANAIFEQVFKENLAPSQEDGIFNFAYPSYVSGSANVTFKENMNLASPDTAEYQILEDMKYKAPLEIGESVIDGFLSITTEIQKASEYADVAKDVQKEIEKRDEAIEEAEAEINEYYDYFEQLNQNVSESMKSDFPTVLNYADIKSHIERYREIIEEVTSENESDEEAEENNESDLEDAILFEKNAQLLVEEDSLLILYLRVETGMVTTLNKLEKAQKHNDNARELLEKKGDKSSDYSNANAAAEELSSSNQSISNEGVSSEIDDAKKELEKLLYPDSYFKEILEPFSEATEYYYGNNDNKNVSKKLDDLKAVLGDKNQLGSSSVVGVVRDKVDDFNKVFKESQEQFSRAYTAFFNKPEIETEKTDKEVEAEKDVADENLEEINKNIDELIDEAIELGKDYDEYEELKALVDQYISFAEGSDVSRDRDRDSLDSVTESSTSMIDSLFNAVGEQLLNARDKLYVNEYILLKFSSHDFSKSGVEAYGISNNEVEYIMYGQSTSAGNFSAAMSELFLFRFLVNFVEAFTVSYVKGFGPYMWIAATAYALKETTSDMINFMSESTVLFFKDYAFAPSYKDYLRLFLFVHGEGKSKPRMMARIHQQTNKDLTSMPTYIQGEAETSLKLWFLPGIADLLSDVNILKGDVENGEFRIRKKAVYSY